MPFPPLLTIVIEAPSLFVMLATWGVFTRLFSIAFFAPLLKSTTEKRDRQKNIFLGCNRAWSRSREHNFATETKRWRLESFKVTNVKAIKRLGYYFGVMYCEQTLSSKRWVDVEKTTSMRLEILNSLYCLTAAVCSRLKKFISTEQNHSKKPVVADCW